MLFENVPNLELWGNEFVIPSADHLEKFITWPITTDAQAWPLRAQTAYPAVRPSNSFIAVSRASAAYQKTENSWFEADYVPFEIMIRN
jgi:hypothetical protein